jgi:ParB-like chromosome segregation protein Spo0J
MKAHPVAEYFPLMTDGELQELAADIRARGLEQPIMVQQGVILDGRNRLRACELASVAPRFQEWTSSADPSEWIISVNWHRRHLNESQRALVAARLRERQKPAVFEAGRQKRMRPRGASENASAEDASGDPVEQSNTCDTSCANLRTTSAEGPARALNVSPRSTVRASRVLQKGSKPLIAAVQAGDVSIFAAETVLHLPKGEQLKELQRQTHERETAKVRDRNKPRWPGDLRAFELRYNSGGQTRKDEAELLRPLDLTLKRVDDVLNTVVTAWLSRGWFEIADLVPEAKAALAAAQAAHAKVAGIIAALEKEAAA